MFQPSTTRPIGFYELAGKVPNPIAAAATRLTNKVRYARFFTSDETIEVVLRLRGAAPALAQETADPNGGEPYFQRAMPVPRKASAIGGLVWLSYVGP